MVVSSSSAYESIFSATALARAPKSSGSLLWSLGRGSRSEAKALSLEAPPPRRGSPPRAAAISDSDSKRGSSSKQAIYSSRVFLSVPEKVVAKALAVFASDRALLDVIRCVDSRAMASKRSRCAKTSRTASSACLLAAVAKAHAVFAKPCSEKSAMRSAASLARDAESFLSICKQSAVAKAHAVFASSWAENSAARPDASEATARNTAWFGLSLIFAKAQATFAKALGCHFAPFLAIRVVVAATIRCSRGSSGLARFWPRR
mmetsp:Transcript_17850/g.60273  ORF Transcript_17850/g.60273 Transcript_17850/m.60273 type:complete len:261 (-) Transcript_17850:211-993(-)